MFFKTSSDHDWKLWGKQDPYFGVLTDDRYRKAQNKNEFLQTGEDEISQLISLLNSLGIQPGGNALDYGCGVGRLSIPLAKYYTNVTGIDVSEGMLSEARKNSQNLQNTDYVLYDSPLLNCLEGRKYNFINSLIVFQHIDPEQGKKILDTLLSQHLSESGVARLGFFTGVEGLGGKTKHFISQARANNRLTFALSKIALGKVSQISDPVLRMNIYPESQLEEIFSKSGCSIIHKSKQLDKNSYVSTDYVIGKNIQN